MSLTLDCLRPTLPLVDYRKHEGRYHVMHGHNQYAPIPGLPAHP